MHAHKYIYVFILSFQFPISGSEKVLRFLQSLVDLNIKQNMTSNKRYLLKKFPRESGP